METVHIEEPGPQLGPLIDKVCKSNTPVTVSMATGNSVKIIPVPKPVGYRKGRPIYKDDDLQFLFLEYPFLFERE